MAYETQGEVSGIHAGKQVALTPAYAAVLAEEGGEPTPRRASPTDAFHLARRWFLAGERLDMQQIAAELGVSRGTLYRWTGGRDRLLADVMTSIAGQTLDNAASETTSRGASRIIEILDRYLAEVASAPFLRSFLVNDSAVALRVLTGRHGGVQDRLVDRIALLIELETRDGAFVSSVDTRTLAYATVRLMEAFVYNDTVTELEPNLEAAHAVLEALLRG